MSDPSTGDWGVMGEKSLPITGGCLCGEVRYEASEEPYWTGYCHCDTCKRAFGGPFGVFVSFRKQAFHFTHGEPTLYQSSKFAKRGFCAQCGTPLLMLIIEGTPQGESESVLTKGLYPGMRRAEAISLSIGSLDHPANFQPVEHGCTDRQLPWLNIDDDLPRDDTDVAAAEPEA